MCGMWSPACLKQVEAREPEGGDVVCAGHSAPSMLLLSMNFTKQQPGWINPVQSPTLMSSSMG